MTIVQSGALCQRRAVPGDPRRPQRLQRQINPIEFLFLVNGMDDNDDGYIDNGWDGIDNDGDGIVDNVD